MSESQRRHRADPEIERRMRAWMLEGFSPEEWAARNAHDILSFSLDRFEYADPALDRWVRDLGRVFFTPGAVAAARRRYLTAAEVRSIKKREQEPF
jgi:hypothetical protein